MKNQIKHRLSDWGLLPAIDNLRRLPDISLWVWNGCTGLAPPPIKRRVIATYLGQYKLREFIETGTHLGDTLAYVARDKKIRCASIELALDFYQKASERFSAWQNVNVKHGDSGEVIPEIVQALEQPALFWLDGHYSGGETAKGEKDTPVSDELAAILGSPIKSHVILIDDARCFNGTDGYPHLGQLLETVRSSSNYKVEVSADIIRLTP